MHTLSTVSKTVVKFRVVIASVVKCGCCDYKCRKCLVL